MLVVKSTQSLWHGNGNGLLVARVDLQTLNRLVLLRAVIVTTHIVTRISSSLLYSSPTHTITDKTPVLGRTETTNTKDSRISTSPCSRMFFVSKVSHI